MQSELCLQPENKNDTAGTFLSMMMRGVIVLPGKSGSRVLAQIQLHVFFCLNFLLLIKLNIA